MKQIDDISGYHFKDAEPIHTNAYLLPTVESVLKNHFCRIDPNVERRIFDLGCGNGSVGAHLADGGYRVIGVDPSTNGIEQANRNYPQISAFVGSAYEDLREQYGEFPAVISLEVVEHVYAPREFATTLCSLVEPGGIAIISTPYHGYLKNLALAATGKMDNHFTALWDHGHIKFWSMKTLGQLLRESGFSKVEFHRVGRVPVFAKSMIAVAQKS